MKKVSQRAVEILSVISKCTKDGCFWLPTGDGRGSDDWSDMFQKFINIMGAGDASILRSMEKSNLIRRPKTTLRSKYVYVATSAGEEALAEQGS